MNIIYVTYFSFQVQIRNIHLLKDHLEIRMMYLPFAGLRMFQNSEKMHMTSKILVKPILFLNQKLAISLELLDV